MNPTDPTPEQIKERCAEIRGGWTADETLRRLRCDLRPFVFGADRFKEHIMAADDYGGHHETHEGLQAAGDG